jgi:hypothetical protein
MPLAALTMTAAERDRLPVPCAHSARVDGKLGEVARSGLKADDLRQIVGFTARDPEAVAALHGCAHIIHAGDIGSRSGESRGVLDALARIAPLTVVRGNNDRADWAAPLPWTADVEFDEDSVSRPALMPAGSYVMIVISDNGVGREKAAEIKKRQGGHTSFSSSAIQKRIDLINSTSLKPLKLEISDLQNASGMPEGTSVKLVVPYRS